MKKNLFLSLLGLTGMLAFTLTPAFAQEAEEVYEPANEEVVVDSDATVDEGIVVDTESVEEVAEPAAEPTFEESIRNNPELVDELNNSMDELLVAIDDENFTNEFNAGFETPEDRAVATAGL
ncbi:hypothetical protein IJU97_06505 [bacterium]|nr:hypothetical protein [bacterium]